MAGITRSSMDAAETKEQEDVEKPSKKAVSETNLLPEENAALPTIDASGQDSTIKTEGETKTEKVSIGLVFNKSKPRPIRKSFE